MKMLCLHPWGTSGIIFEKQMGTLSEMLGPTHEYVYINGGYESAPARDLPSFVKGPYYCWYEGLSSLQCAEAHGIITETIEEDGPFDGVVGFSQGATVALSYLLHHEHNRPGVPSPFRFALFMCANVPISPDPKFNYDMVAKYSRYYRAADEKIPKEGEGVAGGDGESIEMNGGLSNTRELKDSKRTKAAPKHRAMLLLPGRKEALVEELVHLVHQMSSNVPGRADQKNHSWRKDGTPEDFPRLMHPLTIKARVPIPTVHVVGQGDPLVQHSELAVRLCDRKCTKVIHFNGGHQLPTSPLVLRSITAAVEWAIQKGQLL